MKVSVFVRHTHFINDPSEKSHGGGCDLFQLKSKTNIRFYLSLCNFMTFKIEKNLFMLVTSKKM